MLYIGSASETTLSPHVSWRAACCSCLEMLLTASPQRLPAKPTLAAFRGEIVAVQAHEMIASRASLSPLPLHSSGPEDEVSCSSSRD
jgi:hypothetical protein